MIRGVSDITFKKLFGYLVLFGSTCNTLVFILSVIDGDYLLAGICLYLASVSILGYFILSRLERYLGVHLMLFSYLVSFTYASTTHLISYPLVLVYPTILGLVILFFQNSSVKNLYFATCVIGALINLVFTQIHVNNQANVYVWISVFTIGAGLILAFYIMTQIHTQVLYKYQRKLEKSEQELREKNTELKTYIDSNLQLENFAFLASHELKTPLSNLLGFSDLLGKKLNGKLKPEDEKILAVVQTEASRMDQLIAELLQLSIVSHYPINFAPLNVKAHLEALIQKCYVSQSQYISIKALPEQIDAFPPHIETLFNHLIDNALKFCQSGKNWNVEIWGEEKEDHYLFQVRDNGIGIKDEFKDKIFLIFKRLHLKQKYAGTGIGLALCKKIVERHGGKIWVEDNPGGGSIFSFTIARDLAETSSSTGINA